MLLTYDIAGIIEAGTDEAGRGCIARPVYAAASILAKTFRDDYMREAASKYPGTVGAGISVIPQKPTARLLENLRPLHCTARHSGFSTDSSGFSPS